MNSGIEVRTPGRLHFGLTCFGNQGRQFGGIGAMIEDAGVVLSVSTARSFCVSGPLQERVKQFAHSFAQQQRLATLPACKITVTSHSPEHAGLGVGTQLGLAVAAGLAEWQGIAWRDANLLCQMSGRGKRSAVGTHGFLHGGLLADGGKAPGELLGALEERVDLPADWRFVLARQPAGLGLAGEPEEKAINALPPVAPAVKQHLQKLIKDQIIPAARRADWNAFSEALYDYGFQAGGCFAAAQGGPFASPEIASFVKAIRSLGIPGVGQSSWGPTVFALTPTEQDANQLVTRLQSLAAYGHYEFKIARPNNTGVDIVRR